MTLADLPEVTALVNRVERHWEMPLSTTEALMESEMTEPFVDLGLDSRGYWLDGSLVAYGLVWHRPSGERLERAYLQGAVDPDRRGQGIGRELFSWELERAKESLARCDPTLPWYVRTDEWEWIDDAHRLYRRFGLAPVRYMKEMIRSLDEQAEVAVPEEIEIVSWDRSRDEEARLTLNEAFADHWGSTPADVASFQHHLDSDETRIDLSFLALAGDAVVGACINAEYPDDEAVTGRREGWIMSLGVSRAWRGQGVATALIGASLNAFFDDDLSHAMLRVDSENPTGAFGLYENLGFEVLQGTITSEIQVNRP